MSVSSNIESEEVSVLESAAAAAVDKSVKPSKSTKGTSSSCLKKFHQICLSPSFPGQVLFCTDFFSFVKMISHKRQGGKY